MLGTRKLSRVTRSNCAEYSRRAASPRARTSAKIPETRSSAVRSSSIGLRLSKLRSQIFIQSPGPLRLFFKNVRDRRDDDAAAADGTQGFDGRDEPVFVGDDGDRVPAFTRARDDRRDGWPLQAAEVRLREERAGDGVRLFAAHVGDDHVIFLPAQVGFDVF